MNLNNAKTFLIEKGYQIGPRFKLKRTSKYWLYDVTKPDGTKESMNGRSLEMLARRVSREV